MSISWISHTFENLDSTQETLKNLAEDEAAPEGTYVQASVQSRGRGRHGRAWCSPEGNLYISFLLRPACYARDIGQLSVLAGLAVARAVNSFLPEHTELFLKWPNDLLLAGGKCAGILLETDIDAKGYVRWVALGVGINIETSPPNFGACIKDYTRNPPPLHALKEALLSHVSSYYALWRGDGFEEIRKAWLDFSCSQGTPVQVKTASKVERGFFYGIDPQGNLLLHDGDNQLKTITAGQVYLYS